MALADTARLIAALELQDKFTGPSRRAEGSLDRLDRKMGTIGASGQRLGSGLSRAFSTIAKIGVGLAAGGLAVLSVNIKKGVDSLNELQAVTVATETVLDSTNEVAGISAKRVRELAEEYEDLNSTIDDKVIQNAENLLLTFTNVRKDAFEPALEAALNMNQALGGGEEGLQNTIIKLGTVLNDPVRGLAKLTRAGVQFSDEQKERIKRLQEEGDLYGAQLVVLEELSTQFGGQFAAAGQTAEGRMAKLGDTIEDLQQRLAGPLIPAIDRVRDKLITILSTDRAQQAAQKIGESIASIFDQPNIDRAGSLIGDLLDKFNSDDFDEGFTTASSSLASIADNVKGLPWQAIGDAARLLGTGSKALLDAFLELPPWVQTAVLTGWGLNKLTGGAVGTVLGEIFKQVVGIRANTVIVQGGVTGGPGGGPPIVNPRGPRVPGIPGVGNLLKLIPVIAALEAGANLAGGTGPVEGLFDREGTNRQPIPVTDKPSLAAGEKNRQTLEALHAQLKRFPGELGGPYLNPIRQRIHELNASEESRFLRNTATVNGVRDTIRGSNATLAQIRDKRTSFNVTTNVQAFVTATLSASQVVSQAQAYAKQTFNGTLE